MFSTYVVDFFIREFASSRNETKTKCFEANGHTALPLFNSKCPLLKRLLSADGGTDLKTDVYINQPTAGCRLSDLFSSLLYSNVSRSDMGSIPFGQFQFQMYQLQSQFRFLPTLFYLPLFTMSRYSEYLLGIPTPNSLYSL